MQFFFQVFKKIITILITMTLKMKLIIIWCFFFKSNLGFEKFFPEKKSLEFALRLYMAETIKEKSEEGFLNIELYVFSKF